MDKNVASLHTRLLSGGSLTSAPADSSGTLPAASGRPGSPVGSLGGFNSLT